MIDYLISFSIRNKGVIGALVGLWLLWGLYALSRLPLDAVPDVTNNQVQVITRSPALAPVEIEQYITAPVEYGTANIPGLVERRSISRFGLSVVTLVFEEGIDVYWARAQVLERLQAITANIPAGMGMPELGPVSSGLGEVYQYTLQATTPADSSFNLMQLRTIQDWTVRLQLLGTPGVADVSSFGGYVKEYQAQLDPMRMAASGCTLTDVYKALAEGNGNTGGAYLEKDGQALFVRGLGLIQSLDDMRSLVVKKTSTHAPILLKEVATVTFGYSTRYGALTQNGHEAVGGIVLMQKGANSRMVIAAVKERIAAIQQTLPPGLVIEAFIDRSELVNRTISTVATNLIEGGLIVVFVLVLLLGNLRAGLVVASVIPLAMLFAFGMMYATGVSGNLMSLGAIDFGLIVDGAIIIVENVVRHIAEAVQQKNRKLTPTEMDDTVYTSSIEIRKSAAFGEIIILIVYLPLLALSGIEGKMFQPMALTVCYAIIGALILSLTYVPMMSALVLKRDGAEHKRSLPERFLNWLYHSYEPFLHKALAWPKTVIALAAGLLAGTALLFTTLGGEFIPKLDEGNYAIEFRLPPGVSLSKTIAVCSEVERVLLDTYPDEISKVVGKIGTSEIPTDPMPIEAADLIVSLKPMEGWKRAKTKAELTDKLAASLRQVPGAAFSIQQPIEMRFNELISGAKSDVVIKVLGPELGVLSSSGEHIATLITPIAGVSDVFVQRIEGLPQVEVVCDRQALATYGLTVMDVNRAIQTAYAGAIAGVVFETGKRYALSLRMAEAYRKTPAQMEALLIGTESGQAIPLGQVARVQVGPGPAEVAHEKAQRRIAINFNVRGRDVESVVTEIDNRLRSNLPLPPGYRITYGGQFESLQHARSRLLVVVPLAIALICLLLYFTFHSVVETLLILTAIPLAAIGGVVALALRGMPFSISAGVGFIALSGVAVLNGIVLISYLNQLEGQGIVRVKERIYRAVRVRFRPVIMTALVASLGFLPMALGSGAGAEVQRPLATVVIGGLVTATMLTLLVLPVLYALVKNRDKKELTHDA